LELNRLYGLNNNQIIIIKYKSEINYLQKNQLIFFMFYIYLNLLQI
jgi:hypothetical protein